MSHPFTTKDRRPAFVLNRNAGRFRKAPTLIDEVVREVGGRGDVYPTSSPSELREAAQRIVALGASPVVLCGGDGTYLASITAIANAAGSQALPAFVLV